MGSLRCSFCLVVTSCALHVRIPRFPADYQLVDTPAPMWQDIDFGDVMPNFSDIHPVFDIQCLGGKPFRQTL